ncbi:hypothetical protein [Achromobacter aegrifaciens]|uniref:hypothetical protein n=1 Tax=Achromobacter aegrifaciens TaxID=1287736 RepID=UPI001583A42D|nr:hypothetical protein [Achromobacter aegrifaciens]
MLSRKKIFVLAVLFAALFVLLLPIRPVWDTNTTLTLRLVATGQKNAAAQSAEIWVDAETTRQILANVVRQDPAWETRDGFLLSYRNQPGAIEAKFPVEPGTKMTLTSHDHSGILELTVDGRTQTLDLYSADRKSFVVDLGALAGKSINVPLTADKIIPRFLAALVCALLAGWAMGRRRVPAGFDAADTSLHWRRTLLLALPALAIYLISLLAYWPAQMSSDSITQWLQLVTGHYDDSHPVLSTLFYAVPYALHPSLPAVMAFQAALFAWAGAMAISEAMAWGLGRRLAVVAAIVFPLFPPNFLLATTMWQDVPFAIMMFFMTVLAAREARLRFTLSNGSLIALTLVGVLMIGVRHNGILVAAPFFLLLLWLAPRKVARIKVALALFTQIAAFVLFKTIVLSAMGATGVGSHYKAIYALHVLGAMEHANVQWEPQERQLVEQTLPKQGWAEGYRCESSVPLFWSPYVKYDFLAQHHAELNALALKSILRHPLVFLNHQLCLTGLVWRLTAKENEWLPLAPLIVFDMPLTRQLGLVEDSKLSWLKGKITGLHETRWAKASTLLRPALYVFVGLFVLVVLMMRRGKAVMLIAIPLIFNALSLVPFIGSQDYRFMWPSVVAAMFIVLLGAALAFPRAAGAGEAASKI